MPRRGGAGAGGALGGALALPHLLGKALTPEISTSWGGRASPTDEEGLWIARGAWAARVGVNGCRVPRANAVGQRGIRTRAMAYF
eukprot:scaffold4057_cov129-Isochrysis_galbana.AAC.1